MSKITATDISEIRYAIAAAGKHVSPTLKTMIVNLTDGLESQMLRAEKAEQLLAAETKRADDNKDSWKRWEAIAERTMDHQASVITQLGIRAENAEKELKEMTDMRDLWHGKAQDLDASIKRLQDDYTPVADIRMAPATVLHTRCNIPCMHWFGNKASDFSVGTEFFIKKGTV